MKLRFRIRIARAPLGLALFALFAPSALAQGDAAVVQSLIQEGKNNSHVWNTLETLSEVIGPRLTGSTRLLEANAWTRDEFRRMGLENAHLAKWGTIPVGFDRGPSYAHMEEPVHREFEFTTRSWGAGTDGPVRAEVVMRPGTLEELAERGTELEGRWVLCPKRQRRPRRDETAEQKAAREEQEAIDAAIDEMDIVGRLVSSGEEIVITSAVRGWDELTMDTLPTRVEVLVRQSDYDAMAAELAKGAAVTVEADLANHFVEGPIPVYNTIAEIPGTERPDEVVIISGHLDSWDGPGSQGAQDNGTGVSVALEAARILMAVGVQPKRTIRFCLWTGEEQGLLGSRAYVEQLSDAEKAGISVVFVDDGGTNYQGGVACIEKMRPMLDAAIAPIQAAFPELPMENTTRDRMPRMGASDHASFTQVGIPAFFWDEKGSGGREGKDYNFIHHTQHDRTRYAVEEYLVQSATCSAVVAYELAMADTMLPRETEADLEAAAPPPDPSFHLAEGPFSGRWSVSLLGEGAPDMTLDLAIELSEDGRVRGVVAGPMGEERIREGTWNPEEARFTVVSDFGKVDWDARVREGVLEGNLQVMGQEMPFRGERVVSEPTAISGMWKGLILSMDAEFTLFIEVDEEGNVSGRFQSSQSDSELFDASFDPTTQTLEFEYDYPHAGRLPVEAHLDGDELVGVIGEQAEFEATREEED
ncbi:MAG TPA: M20/M25/M40 family metallo-hydrolase [Planctomycetes bacterium]|nr:M20/M25/M40 family metallo-hydrolase [Planctomycetota bacterium]